MHYFNKLSENELTRYKLAIQLVSVSSPFCSSPIGASSLTFLAQMLGSSATISYVALPGIGLKDADVKGLVKIISSCASLTQVILGEMMVC
jgi:hypothetical protein